MSFFGDVLLEISRQAPSPNKDFVHMKVKKNEIIWNYWKINPQCLKPDAKVTPTEIKCSFAEFKHDSDFQTEVKRIFGETMLTYLKNLCDGHINFFDRLEKKLQIFIISHLDLEDIVTVSRVNRHFKELCDSNLLWEHLVDKYCDTVTPDMRLYGEEVGWKQVFFTNKLQLQMQIRRHKQKSVEFSPQM